ncbi:hypothetical protein [Xanthobacter autotrophicus]|uniref:hypothetical protein n=1 Tax=Xanthobacter autotrophicus TaxID=280 RepID=UPI003726626C
MDDKGWLAWLADALAALKLPGLAKGAALLAVLGFLFVLGAREGWYFSSRLHVERLRTDMPAQGMVYFLPRTAFDVTLTYRISDCNVTQPDDRPILELKATIAADLAARVEADLGHGYVVADTSFAGPLWNSSLVIQTQGGLLQLLNTSARSELAPPKAFTAEGLLEILTSASPPKSQSSSSAEELAALRNRLCGSSLVAALDSLKMSSAQAGSLPTELTTISRSFHFVPGEKCPIGTTAKDNATDLEPGCMISGQATVGTLLTPEGSNTPQVSLYAVEIKVARLGASPTQPAPPSHGLVYRVPGQGMFTACVPRCDAGTSKGANLLASQTVQIAQYGFDASIQIERRLFADRTMILEFGPAGDLIRVSSGDAQAAGAPAR